MNQPVVKEWVSALRSGEYEQAKEVLATEHGYCCLGVLCELYSKTVKPIKTIVQNEIEDDVGNLRTVWDTEYDKETEILPKCVMEWAGLRSPEGGFTDASITSLASLNDNGKTFAEIADVIESKPQGLFVEADMAEQTRLANEIIDEIIAEEKTQTA